MQVAKSHQQVESDIEKLKNWLENKMIQVLKDDIYSKKYKNNLKLLQHILYTIYAQYNKEDEMFSLLASLFKQNIGSNFIIKDDIICKRTNMKNFSKGFSNVKFIPFSDFITYLKSISDTKLVYIRIMFNQITSNISKEMQSMIKQKRKDMILTTVHCRGILAMVHKGKICFIRELDCNDIPSRGTNNIYIQNTKIRKIFFVFFNKKVDMKEKV